MLCAKKSLPILLPKLNENAPTSMAQVSPTETRVDECGVSFTVYADFNCPFCYALNERLHAAGLADRVEFRTIQHAPSISSRHAGLKIISDLTNEVADVRRRAPSTQINVPMFRPNTEAASALQTAINRQDPARASLLRRRIFQALWVEGRDISDPGLLGGLLGELEIEPPAEDPAVRQEMGGWQQAWDDSHEFDHNIPIVISERGETVIGFPLEPEMDAFLKTGSLITDDTLHGVCEKDPLPRILMLDDDADSVRMVVEQMRDAQVEVVTDFAGLVDAALNKGMPDLVLADTALLGGIEGTDWWRNETDSDLDIAVPVVFVSNDASTRTEAEAFEAGAADFIAKPFHSRVLRARLALHLRARRAQQQLNNLARVDPLTSICNRREFDLRLMTEWSRGARTGKSLGLLMIDVDRFKEYNDRHGHLRGDDCLVAVAGILQECMNRAGDTIARFGGEEFVALLPEADLEGALKVAEQCRLTVAAAEIPHVASDVAAHVTVSVGVAAMVPLHNQSSMLLIEQADVGLYQAKQKGRNRICSIID